MINGIRGRTMPTTGGGAPTKDETGKVVCRWCRGDITEKRRKTFCSSACVEEWMLRTRPEHARRRVFERDAGVCALCGLQTQRVERILRALRNLTWGSYSRFSSARDGGLWPIASRVHFERARAIYGRLRARGFDCWVFGSDSGHAAKMGWRTPWHMDHIVPVVEGGGVELPDQLANLRTLCTPCHKKVTRDLNRRLKEQRDALSGKSATPLLEVLRRQVSG